MAPLPAQIPNPSQLFNGNPMMAPHHTQPVPMHPNVPVQQQQQQQQQQIPIKPATVTAVENAFFNQMKYSQQQQQQQGPSLMNASNPNRYIEDFQSSSILFLQDSMVDQHQTLSQPKMPSNFVSQPKLAIVLEPSTQTHHFPPGLKLQPSNAANIPVNFPHQQQPSQEPPILYSSQPTSVSQQQFPQKMPTNIPNLQDIEQKTTALAQQHQQQQQHQTQSSSHDRDLLDNRTTVTSTAQLPDKDKNRSNEWNPVSNQQQPQIDTWNNEAPAGSGNGGNYSRYNRGIRSSGSSGNGAKYGNYR